MITLRKAFGRLRSLVFRSRLKQAAMRNEEAVNRLDEELRKVLRK